MNTTQENGQEQEKAREKIKGVFSTQSLVSVGTGTTQRKTIQKTYWFVEEREDKQFDVQPLNVNYVPSGPKKVIPLEDLLQNFSTEPEFYTYTVLPKMREINKTIARADRHRQNGETFSAEMEYSKAIKVDEENVRANFGLGLTYLERGNTEKANDIFQRLVKLETTFDPEHKHLFNEFGISLRKNKMIDQALDYYSRAMELSTHDENLFYNVARAHFEKGDMKQTVDFLYKALELNPQLEEAKKFMDFLKEKKLIP